MRNAREQGTEQRERVKLGSYFLCVGTVQLGKRNGGGASDSFARRNSGFLPGPTKLHGPLGNNNRDTKQGTKG